MEATTTTARHQRLLLLFPLGSLLIFLVDRFSVRHDYLFYLGLSIPALVFITAFWIIDRYHTPRHRTLRLARLCSILVMLTSLIEFV